MAIDQSINGVIENCCIDRNLRKERNLFVYRRIASIILIHLPELQNP